MPNEFIYCPRCESGDIEETDYEDESGEEDVEGRRCNSCGWEGDRAELVCKPIKMSESCLPPQHAPLDPADAKHPRYQEYLRYRDAMERQLVTCGTFQNWLRQAGK